jgi:hypothetical protein
MQPHIAYKNILYAAESLSAVIYDYIILECVFMQKLHYWSDL